MIMSQTQIEQLIHPKHIKGDIKQELIEYMDSSIWIAVKAIKKWIAVKEWDSKNVRKQLLADLDLHTLIADILTSITMYCIKPLPLVSVASMVNISMS